MIEWIHIVSEINVKIVKGTPDFIIRIPKTVARSQILLIWWIVQFICCLFVSNNARTARSTYKVKVQVFSAELPQSTLQAFPIKYDGSCSTLFRKLKLDNTFWIKITCQHCRRFGLWQACLFWSATQMFSIACLTFRLRILLKAAWLIARDYSAQKFAFFGTLTRHMKPPLLLLIKQNSCQHLC
jgi:hypothetical protein